MIIVSMGCGLGNQMFEYAFITKLGILYPEQIIKADTKYAFPYAHNGIELFDIFNLSAEIASKEEVLRLAGKHRLHGEGFEKKTIIDKVLKKIRVHPSSMLIQKDFTEYYEKFEHLDPGRSYYFYGPFANYRYFKDIQNNIRELYHFPEITDDSNLEYAKQIQNSNSVSLHIRGGDYIQEGVQPVPLEFYRKAIETLEERIGQAEYFVFSDDHEYAKSLFPDVKRYVFVEGNTGSASYRDMQLMSMCRHNITANSTFSFWGAFLNGNEDKIVIAPDIPFKHMKNAFVCDDWVVI